MTTKYTATESQLEEHKRRADAAERRVEAALRKETELQEQLQKQQSTLLSSEDKVCPNSLSGTSARAPLRTGPHRLNPNCVVAC